MYNLKCPTKKEWAMDYGFRKALVADPDTITFGLC